eukprot:Em0007g99a
MAAVAADKPTNKQLAETFFEINALGDDHACRYEDCKKKNKKVAQVLKNGYKNLMSHLQHVHPNYLDDSVNRAQPGRRNAQLQFVTVKKTDAENLCAWFDLILKHNLPLCVVDDPDFRKAVRLDAISSKRIKSVGSRLVRVVEGVLGVKMLGMKSLGLIFDGWGKRVDGTAYFAIMAAGDFGLDETGNRLPSPLLAFAPFLDETNHTAEEQLSFATA